jgi:hypothetical protein
MRAPLMAVLVALGASAASAQIRVPANRLAGIQGTSIRGPASRACAAKSLR